MSNPSIHEQKRLEMIHEILHARSLAMQEMDQLIATMAKVKDLINCQSDRSIDQIIIDVSRNYCLQLEDRYLMLVKHCNDYNEQLDNMI